MGIRVAVIGHGNLGRGVEKAIAKNPDMELCGIFTRRDPSKIEPITTGVGVYGINDIEKMAGAIDVAVLCGGSATDLPVQTPMYAELFNVVDSFDTHANIPEHFDAVDKAAKKGKNAAVISVGWDPGLFSVARAYMMAALPGGKSYTFWGRGVSQGHSDAIRRIDGVLDARQYTVPVPSALESVRRGEDPELTTRQKHTRECYVVLKEGADKAKVEHEIVTMPNYFADYDTTVYFISEEDMKKEHSSMPHGGSVIRSGRTGLDDENKHVAEFSLKLDSNPEFTSSVLVAYARAVVRLKKEGKSGCFTALDIPPAYLLSESEKELYASIL